MEGGRGREGRGGERERGKREGVGEREEGGTGRREEWMKEENTVDAQCTYIHRYVGASIHTYTQVTPNDRFILGRKITMPTTHTMPA